MYAHAAYDSAQITPVSGVDYTLLNIHYPGWRESGK